MDEAGDEVADGASLQMVLLTEGTDPELVGQVPQALLTIPGQEQAWIADPEEIELSGLNPGESQINNYTIDGNRGSGTATFFERESWFAWSGGTAESYQVAEGQFEATCNG